MPLDEMIEQLLALGYKDLREMLAELDHRHGEETINQELLGDREMILLDRLRQVSRRYTRRAELALVPRSPKTRAELLLTPFAYPDDTGVWHRLAFGDATREMLMLRAAWDRRLEAAVGAHADWCEQLAAMLAAENVERLVELQGEFPALPPTAREIAA